MRKWLVLGLMFLAGAGVSRAQSDIQISWKGPFGDIARNAVVGQSGPGGTNNAFIISFPAPQTQACIYINNKSGGTISQMLFNAYTTTDQQVKGYYSNSEPWVPVNIQGQQWYFPAGNNFFSLQPSSTSTFSVGPIAGQQLALVINTASGGPLDIFYAFGGALGCNQMVGSKSKRFLDITTETAAGTYVKVLLRPMMGALIDYQGTAIDLTSCSVTFDVATLTGTSPTAIIYVQNQNENGIDDRISSLSFSAPGVAFAHLNMANTNAVAHAPSNAALAASMEVGGFFDPAIQISYKLGGTISNFTGTTILTCQ